MTFDSFREALETLAPETLTASHYALAPDAYGLEDGYAWAFSEGAHGGQARHHLPDGGEWPYYIAARPEPTARACDRYTIAGALNAAPHNPNAEKITGEDAAAALAEDRVLETYCEGDLAAYIFDTREDREAAAAAWQETREEYTARILGENYPHEDAENLAAAVLAEACDGWGETLDGAELRERVAAVMDDRYAGEWGSLADYVEDCYESTTPSHDLWGYIDWERVARDWEHDGYSTHPAPGGRVYVFRGE